MHKLFIGGINSSDSNYRGGSTSHIFTWKKLGYRVASSQINTMYFLIITGRWEQLSRRRPCGKRRRKASHMLNTCSWYQPCIYVGRQQPFPKNAAVCARVAGLAQSPAAPLVKHITQMCHNLGCGWMLLKASARHQQQSGASFDEEMEFLQFLPCCSPVRAVGTLLGRFLIYRIKNLSSLCPIPSKIGNSVKKMLEQRRWKN